MYRVESKPVLNQFQILGFLCIIVEVKSGYDDYNGLHLKNVIIVANFRSNYEKRFKPFFGKFLFLVVFPMFFLDTTWCFLGFS